MFMQRDGETMKSIAGLRWLVVTLLVLGFVCPRQALMPTFRRTVSISDPGKAEGDHRFQRSSQVPKYVSGAGSTTALR